MNLFPLGVQMWSRWIAVLAVIGIVYAAAVALRQSDLKFVIGYSSVVTWALSCLAAATAARGLGRGPADVSTASLARSSSPLPACLSPHARAT
jgi:NADH:ubiquinone oxidoreductase subunit 4 (subunit M)